MSPCGHVNEIRLRLFSALASVIAVYRNGEGRNGNTGGCGLKLGIGGKPSAYDNLIKIKVCHIAAPFRVLSLGFFACFFLYANDYRTLDTVGDTENTLKLIREITL